MRLAVGDWLQKQGADLKELKVKLPPSFPATAAADIAKGEVLISIPLDLVLDSTKVPSKLAQLIKNQTQRLKTGSVGLTSLALLSEKFAGTNSKYAGYIESLPRDIPGILSWSIDELDELFQSTTRRIKAQIAAVEQDFLTVQNMGIFPKETFTKEEFIWAIGTVKSRSVYVKVSVFTSSKFHKMEKKLV
jgi:hypothetical protein